MAILNWNEIKDRALRFSKEWEGEKRERAEKDTFWNDFFNVFGLSRRRVATFEEPVRKLNDKQGFIDLFWKGTLLVEHKSLGKDLNAAFEQATDYFAGLEEHELPKFVLVSDFARFKLYDLDDRQTHEFDLKDFHNEVKLFGFIAGYQKKEYKPEDPVNVKAAELMGRLYDELEENGYEGHSLEVFLVRLLFCLFADDTSIFEKDIFKDFIELRTREDGSDLGMTLAQFFQVLNTPNDRRQKSLDEQLDAFPYVNGSLFEEQLPIAAFNSKMRKLLLQCCALDWGKISPAIFGSMFQSVMDPEERRNLGAHYTSETNILKLIKPLFLDELWEEFEKVKKNRNKLAAFHKKLGELKFLDPACGCGNFLVITYRELRLLELEILRVQHKNQQVIGIGEVIWIDVDQFYGIEYDEWPARIAEVALWLMDHQMNMKLSQEFGEYFVRLPLKKSATIVHGNALRIDWEEVIPKTELSYILGNPPFIGHQYRTKEQMEDMDLVFGRDSKSRRLDYVAAWFYKSANFTHSTDIKFAFVATNSISQGEQVPILWSKLLLQLGMNIHFAHRTFKWTNEAKGNAGVHVVIVGLGHEKPLKNRLFDYEDVKGEPQERVVNMINGYLAAGPIVFIKSRGLPLHGNPVLSKGSQPTDGGNLLFTDEEKEEFLSIEPNAKPWIRPYMGGAELIQGKRRYCLWLKDCPPNELRKMPAVLERLANVSEMRQKSPTKSVVEFAKYPSLFTQDRQPDTRYLAVPEVSSENRNYIPVGYLTEKTICSNQVQIIPDATLLLFGILMSKMHNVWARTVCGKLESRIRYSPAIYNNLPWPKNPTDKQKKEVETKAQGVLDARAKYPNSSLADLYDPLTMPPELVKAHQELDKAVDKCYRGKAFANETERIEFLFELYNDYTAPLLQEEKSGKGKKL